MYLCAAVRANLFPKTISQVKHNITTQQLVKSILMAMIVVHKPQIRHQSNKNPTKEITYWQKKFLYPMYWLTEEILMIIVIKPILATNQVLKVPKVSKVSDGSLEKSISQVLWKEKIDLINWNL